MRNRTKEAMSNVAVRRAFEEELILDEATDTVSALLDSLGLTQRALADRLSVTPGRVSQILSGDENLTLKTLGALGWALGVRFEFMPSPMADRAGTPAKDDPEVPEWLSRLRPEATVNYGPLTLPPAERVLRNRLSSRVVDGEVRAA